MSYTVRPISDRSAFTGRPVRSPFSSTWWNSRQLLLREVKQLAGRDLVLELDVTESQIRNDGELYANARPTSPAIRVAFESKHGPLTYATDKFNTWQDNVRAIALSLEALRKVDRYGVTKRGEQYTGWKAIGAGRAIEIDTVIPRQTAAEILKRIAIGDEGAARDKSIARILNDRHIAKRVLREARAMVHPDRREGDRAAWDQVERAGKALGLIA